MAKKEIDKLILTKEQIIDNLDTLLARLDECTSLGMKDGNARIYNQTIELQEDVGVLDSYEELNIIIIRSRAIESEIDGWMASQGESTLGLEWPVVVSEPPEIE